MKRCYLQKKINATIQDFRNTLVAIKWYSRITFWHSAYEKNTLVLIFKRLVPSKQGLPRLKFSFENLSPSPTLSYTINKKPKRAFLWRKSCWRSWSSWGSSLITLPLGFTVIEQSLGFLLTGFSLLSSVIGSSISP